MPKMSGIPGTLRPVDYAYGTSTWKRDFPSLIDFAASATILRVSSVSSGSRHPSPTQNGFELPLAEVQMAVPWTDGTPQRWDSSSRSASPSTLTTWAVFGASIR